MKINPVKFIKYLIKLIQLIRKNLKIKLEKLDFLKFF